jgi:hypothetical protein
MRREELKLVINLSSDKFGKHDTQTWSSYFASGENEKQPRKRKSCAPESSPMPLKFYNFLTEAVSQAFRHVIVRIPLRENAHSTASAY